MNNTAAEINEIVDGGWDGVVCFIQQLIQAQLYLLDDIRTNRPTPLHLWGWDYCNAGTGSLTGCMIEPLTALSAYEPVDLPVIEPATAVGFDFPHGKFAPLNESDLKTTCKNIMMKWQVIGSAVDALLSPGMPEPSLADIGSIYVAAKKYINVANLIHTATTANLVPRHAGKVTGDIFAVGSEIAQFADEVLPPHAVRNKDAISVPLDPDLDTAIASYFALWLMQDSAPVYISQSVEFDPRSTSAKKHCTIGCGKPYHAPDRLCFDRKEADNGMNNTELVVASLVAKGINLPFANELIGWSTQAGDKSSFPSRIFATIKSKAGTMPLAMSAWEFYLQDRFELS